MTVHILKARPKTGMISPVNAPYFVDVASYDPGHPAINGALDQAAQIVSDYCRRDLLVREWSGTFYRRRQSESIIRRSDPTVIELPYTGPGSITRIELDGVEVDVSDYKIENGDPIRVNLPCGLFESAYIEYEAGFDVLPEVYRHAIVRVAEYILDHRGCDLESIVSMSGLSTMLAGERVEYTF